MRLGLSTTLPWRLPRLLDELAVPKLLGDISAPMVRFDPIDSPLLMQPGQQWTPGEHHFRLVVGEVLPIGEHTINLVHRTRTPGEFPDDGIVWHDAGFSPLIRVWDHRIRLAPLSGGGVRYTDLVDIRAGALTVPAWLFARAFYAHRQRRLWRLAHAPGTLAEK